MGDIRIVAGHWGRRRLRVPRGLRVRPTPERVREAWLNSLAPLLTDARVLDLFAGSGALGLEALSRGAAHATFVERNDRVLQCLRANIAALGAGDSATVVSRDALTYVDGLIPRAYDVAFADPPYGSGLAKRLLDRFERHPFARLLTLEHVREEPLDLPPGASERRYGDTMIAFIAAPDPQEEPA